MLLEQAHRVTRLEVVRENEHPGVWVPLADRLRGGEAFVRVRWRHLDVDDDQLRPPPLDQGEQLVAVACRSRDLEAGLRQQSAEALAQERLVVRDNHAHGSSSRTTDSPSTPVTATDPPSAPTRSSISTTSAGGAAP